MPNEKTAVPRHQMSVQWLPEREHEMKVQRLGRDHPMWVVEGYTPAPDVSVGQNRSQ